MKKVEILARKQAKNDLVEDKKAIVTNAMNEKRALNDSEKSQIAEIDAQIATLKGEIAQGEEELRMATDGQVEEPVIEKRSIQEVNKDIMKGIFSEDGRIGEVESRDYNIGTGGAGYNDAHKGADSVPLTINQAILNAIDNNTNIFPLATVYRVLGTHRLVLDAEAPVAARLVAEGAQIGTIDSQFRSVELKAHKFAEICKMTNEAVADVNFDLEGYVSRRMVRAFSKAIEQYIVSGTGVSQPQGLLAVTPGAGQQDAKATDVATAGAIDFKAVISAYYKLPHQERANAVFLAHPSVVLELAKVQDAKGRPILVPDVSGEFNTIMGKRVIETDHLQALGTAGNKVAMFVNVKDALAVSISQDLDMRQLNELYAANDMVAIQGILRFDSKIVKPAAISIIRDIA